VESSSVIDVCKALLSSIPQLLAVCMGLLWEVVFWELPAAGDPGGARLACCNELFRGMAPASHPRKHLFKITARGCLHRPPIASSPGQPQCYGRVARCQPTHGHREQGSCVPSKVLHTFLKHFVLLPSLLLQDLGNPPGLCRACFWDKFRSLALLSAFMQLSLQTCALGQLCRETLYWVSGVCRLSPCTSPGCSQPPGVAHRLLPRAGTAWLAGDSWAVPGVGSLHGDHGWLQLPSRGHQPLCASLG